jgi:hypothetical protein
MVQAKEGREPVAFIRKRGHSYYLVHNIRKGGDVQQFHLACLGHRPRITDDVIRAVTAKHPLIVVDWQSLKERASREIIKPLHMDGDSLRELLGAVQSVNLDIAGLHFPTLQMAVNRDLFRQLVSALQLLKTTLEVKLSRRIDRRSALK